MIVGSSVGRTTTTVGNEGIGGKPTNCIHNVESCATMWGEAVRNSETDDTQCKASAWLHHGLGLNDEKSR